MDRSGAARAGRRPLPHPEGRAPAAAAALAPPLAAGHRRTRAERLERIPRLLTRRCGWMRDARRKTARRCTAQAAAGFAATLARSWPIGGRGQGVRGVRGVRGRGVLRALGCSGTAGGVLYPHSALPLTLPTKTRLIWPVDALESTRSKAGGARWIYTQRERGCALACGRAAGSVRGLCSWRWFASDSGGSSGQRVGAGSWPEAPPPARSTAGRAALALSERAVQPEWHSSSER